MKYLLLAFLLLLSSFCVSQSIPSKVVEYEVVIREYCTNGENCFTNNFPLYPTAWLTDIFKAIETGSFNVYSYSNINAKLSKEEASAYLYSSDTSIIIDPITFFESMEVCTRTYKNNIKAIRFREYWTYKSNGEVFKEVQAIAPILLSRSRGRTFLTPVFWIKLGQGLGKSKTIASITEYDMTFKANDSLLTNYKNDLLSWYTSVSKQVGDKTLMAYTEGFPAPALIPVSETEFDTVPGVDEVAEYIKHISAVNLLGFRGVRFREQWDWDKRKGLQKKIIAMAPIIAYYDESGVEYYQYPLFWVKY